VKFTRQQTLADHGGHTMTSTAEHDAASLGAKLDSLSLTDGEAATWAERSQP